MKRSVPRSRRQYALVSPAMEIARDLPGIRAAKFPGFVEPALAQLRPKAPSGKRWVHEVKYDGYRFQLHKRDTGTRMYTRRGYDWTDRVKPVLSRIYQLNSHNVILDGEVVIMTPEGRSDFAALESSLSSKSPSPELRFYAFDILYLEMLDLRGCTLLDRKRVLKAFLDGVEPPIHYSEHLEADGPEIWRQACKLELEGVVSKRVDGKYHSGRTDAWTKTTCRQRETFVLAGVAEKRGHFDGVYLGKREGRRLVYAGKLERGFSDEDKRRILEMQERLKSRKQPIDAPRKFPKARWMKPTVLLDAEFRGKTGEGLLRHPSFKGVRRDLMD